MRPIRLKGAAQCSGTPSPLHAANRCAGAKERRDCAGWLWANRRGRAPSANGASDRPATYALYGPDDADSTTTSGCPGSIATCASNRRRDRCSGRSIFRERRRRRDLALARRGAQAVGCAAMNGEFVSVPRSASNAIAPGAAAVDEARGTVANPCTDTEAPRSTSMTTSTYRPREGVILAAACRPNKER